MTMLKFTMMHTNLIKIKAILIKHTENLTPKCASSTGRLKKAFMDLVYPSNIYCICCGEPIFEEELYSLCKACTEKIAWVNQKSCAKCGKMLQDWYEPEFCIDCSYVKHHFKQGFCCVQYGELERQLVHQLKYHGKGYIGRKLAEMMQDRISFENLDIQYIIPVPIHKLKLRERGYNQASLIGKNLAAGLNWTYCDSLLIRTKDTEPMNQLRPRERRRNMQNAFALGKKTKDLVRDKSILIVDDIFTTGSTVDACSEVLLAAGAKEVYVFTFAAGVNEK